MLGPTVVSGAYVPGAPSPKAALALIERVSGLLDIPVIATDLEIASASYERQVSDVVAELHAIGAENIRRYRGPRQRCFAIESRCSDACDFIFPQAPLLVYLFNPLPPHKLRTVIANLDRSVAECAREVYLLYHHPEHEHVDDGHHRFRLQSPLLR